MPQPLFKGVITALVTPVRNGAVDEAAFVKLVERQIAAGVHGVSPVGTTGETATLSHDEHRRVVELCITTAAGRAPVIAGCGSNATAEAIELARHAKTVGADAALVVAPYNRPNQEGIYAHYIAIAEAVQIPIVVYNVPGRTASDISNETMARLAKHPNIVGVKDATGDLTRVSMMRKTCGDDFVLLSGDDPTALGYIAHGGHGCISVSSNVRPKACVGFMEAALAGDSPGALRWQDRLVRLHKGLFADASPAPTKWALAELGLCAEDVRLPLVPCSEAAKAVVREALARPTPLDKAPAASTQKLIAENRRARYDYFLEETLEAGLSLTGSEVKSLRLGRANVAESYAAVEGDEIVLINAYIPEYAAASHFNHEPRRPRKLLLHRREIDRLIGAVNREGRTLIPTRLYWNDKGLAKLELAVAKGKKAHDKREAEAERDWQRDKARLMREMG